MDMNMILASIGVSVSYTHLIDVLHLFRTHDTRMACITEYAGLGIVLPVSDEGGLLYFVELVVCLLYTSRCV